MTVFYITLVITYILGYFARKLGKSRLYGVREPNSFLFWIVTAIFILVCGLRSNIGDTYFYKHSYIMLANTGSTTGYEIGFTKLMEILVKISSDPQLLIFVVAFICNLFLLLSLRRDATYFELTLYLLITSGYYLVTMNGMRQTMVAAVYFYFGIKFMKEKRIVEYMLLITVLMNFHKSAFFLYPVYFLALEKPFSKRIGLLIAGTTVVTLMFSSFAGAIQEVSGDYGHYIDSFNEGGANILRTAVAGVPVILSYIYRKKLKDSWRYSGIYINLSVLNFIFMILALQNWIFARFCLYPQIASFILLPYIIKNCVPKNQRDLYYIGCIVCYFIYFYYDQAISMRIVYRSLILGIY